MKLRRILGAFLFVVLIVSTGLAQKKDSNPANKPAANETATAPAKGDLVDINSASKEELKALPGIGDAYSQKIIDGRPYANKTQLKSKGIVPDATYNKISDKIIAKQAKK